MFLQIEDGKVVPTFKTEDKNLFYFFSLPEKVSVHSQNIKYLNRLK